MAATIIDRDHGFIALTREVSSRGFSFTVGIHQEEGSQSAAGGGASLADVAAFAEFGTSRAPRRSWLLDGIVEHERDIEEAARRLARRVLKSRGSFSQRQANEVLGEMIVAMLKRRIVAHIPPPLAQSTIERKGHDTPLVDTAQLIQSIRSEVSR